jgi:hypothetical protein
MSSFFSISFLFGRFNGLSYHLLLWHCQSIPPTSSYSRSHILGDRRLSPHLPRGTVNLIGGELDIDDPRLRTNRTPQSLHHCSVGYHLCHANDLTAKAYPCKRNQEHKQEQEMQSNRLDYEMGSHKPMNGDTVWWQNESKKNPNPKMEMATK